jgi:hypothetical protein
VNPPDPDGQHCPMSCCVGRGGKGMAGGGELGAGAAGVRLHHP